MLSLLLNPAFAADGHRVALVVGVEEYADAGMRDLTVTDDDARQVAAWFTEVAGFEVVELSTRAGVARASGAAIRSELSRLAHPDAPLDTLVVYFSGHAISGQEPGAPVAEYLLPADARVDETLDLGSAIPLRWVQEQVAAAGARTAVVVIDGGHGSPFVKGGDPFALGAALAYETPVLTLYAASPQASAREGAELSVYTAAFLDGLAGAADTDGDGQVALRGEALPYLRGVLGEEQVPRAVPVDWQGADLSLPVGRAERVYDAMKWEDVARHRLDRLERRLRWSGVAPWGPVKRRERRATIRAELVAAEKAWAATGCPPEAAALRTFAAEIQDVTSPLEARPGDPALPDAPYAPRTEWSAWSRRQYAALESERRRPVGAAPTVYAGGVAKPAASTGGALAGVSADWSRYRGNVGAIQLDGTFQAKPRGVDGAVEAAGCGRWTREVTVQFCTAMHTGVDEPRRFVQLGLEEEAGVSFPVGRVQASGKFGGVALVGPGGGIFLPWAMEVAPTSALAVSSGGFLLTGIDGAGGIAWRVTGSATTSHDRALYARASLGYGQLHQEDGPLFAGVDGILADLQAGVRAPRGELLARVYTGFGPTWYGPIRVQRTASVEGSWHASPFGISGAVGVGMDQAPGRTPILPAPYRALGWNVDLAGHYDLGLGWSVILGGRTEYRDALHPYPTVEGNGLTSTGTLLLGWEP